MPALPLQPQPNAKRVLITGFGVSRRLSQILTELLTDLGAIDRSYLQPFKGFENGNPSWKAVQKLHNEVLYTQSPVEPVTYHDQAVVAPPRPDASHPIHITAFEIATEYEAVLTKVPGFHARPPQLPAPADPLFSVSRPPEKGYDFIMHVGVAPPGPLRLEKLGDKTGYNKADAAKLLAPVVGSHLDGKEIRGFGVGYEKLSEKLETQLNLDDLLQHLKGEGIEEVRISDDAGHYLCDFIYYCSLAEAEKQKGVHGATPVFFMHCSPEDEPFSTQDVIEAIKKVVIWACARL
ncbi:hypothetical protein EIP91_010123 [Steccherinum ochraceum]|uniref:Peptidase C15, pyroglutamyl peptidase I-like protein n=1 Tax=Steccherinum ochraceum TaxID=92696 RepID=A0A4V2MXU2_9APHY|nr:hypothetical protein EIP91_010123 [Steccherinum ochraceum]